MTGVYLAGPISGLSYAEASHWRREVQRRLSFHKIKTLNPLLPPDGLTTVKMGGGFKGDIIRDRDFILRQADVMLVNFLGAKAVSVGTCVEVGWADAIRLPIITVMEDEGNLHDHSFIRELSGWIVPSIDEAFKIILQLNGTSI